MRRTEHGRLTEQRTADKNMAEWMNQNSSKKMVLPGGSFHTSVEAVRSRAARLRDLKAREELAHLELLRIEAEANLARIRLEKIRVRDKADVLDKEHDGTEHVQNCVQTSPLENNEDILPEQDLRENLDEERVDTSYVQNCTQMSPLEEEERREQHIEGSSQVVKTKPEMSSIQTQARAGATRQGFDNHAAAAKQQPLSPPLNLQADQDVPCCNGLRSEMVVYDGNPDTAVLEELDAITDESQIAETQEETCASHMDNCKLVIHGLLKPSVLVKERVGKLPTYLKSRWYDYADAHEDQESATLEWMVQLLNMIPEKYGAYTPSVKKKELLNRAATHTASKEDEGGGVLRFPSSSGASSCPVVGATHKGENVDD